MLSIYQSFSVLFNMSWNHFFPLGSMENRCQGSNINMFLSFLAISAVMGERTFPHFEWKQDYTFPWIISRQKLKHCLWFHPSLTSSFSSQTITQSWWFYFQNIYWILLLLSIFTATTFVPAWTSIIGPVLRIYSVANNSKLNCGSFDK